MLLLLLLPLLLGGQELGIFHGFLNVSDHDLVRDPVVQRHRGPIPRRVVAFGALVGVVLGELLSDLLIEVTEHAVLVKFTLPFEAGALVAELAGVELGRTLGIDTDRGLEGK